MSAPTVTGVHLTLLQRAEALAAEYVDLPAGSVIRCFARAVGHARRSGCGLNALPDAAESRARDLLSARSLQLTS